MMKQTCCLTKLAILAAILIGVIGCQKRDSKPQAPHVIDPIFAGGDLDPRSPVGSLETVREFLRIANLPEPVCEDAADSACEPVKLTHKTLLTPEPAEPGEMRVLVLESQTIPDLAVTSNRQATLGFYRWDQTRLEFVPRDLDFTMAPKAYQIYYQGRGSDASQIPAAAARGMTGLSPRLGIAEFAVNEHRAGHGEIGYEFLRALNGKARFLFAPIPGLSPENAQGIQLEDPGYLPAMTEQLKAYKSELGRLIRLYRLNRLSVAFRYASWQDYVAASSWRAGFKPTEELKAKHFRASVMVREFWEELAAENEELLIFAGMDNNVETPEYSDPQLLRDIYCMRHPRVFTVGYIHDTKNLIPLDGEVLTDRNTPRVLARARSCIDIAVSAGFVEDPRARDELDSLSEAFPSARSRRGSYMVIDESVRLPLHVMVTSWATPMATSLVSRLVENYRRQNGKDIDLNQLKGLVRGKAFDPFYHGQFLSNPYFEGETESPTDCEAQRVRALYTHCIEADQYEVLKKTGERAICRKGDSWKEQLQRIEKCN